MDPLAAPSKTKKIKSKEIVDDSDSKDGQDPSTDDDTPALVPGPSKGPSKKSKKTSKAKKTSKNNTIGCSGSERSFKR
jgi:hypothetical protein